MEYSDEKIQQIKRELRRNQPLNFAEPVIIDEEEYNFTRTMLFEDQVSILLPAEFVDMPPELAKQKYPMEQRPQIIKTNLGLSVNFAFNLFAEELPENQIKDAVKSFKTLIKRMQPANRFYTDKIDQTGEQIFGWFDFKSPGMDEPLYTIMAFTGIGGQFLHCTFNSAHRLMEDWKPAALQVLRSIQDETKKKELRL